MAEQFEGRVEVTSTKNELRVLIDADTARMLMGGTGEGALVLLLPSAADPARTPDGQETIRMNADTGWVTAGGNGTEGTLRLFTANVTGDEVKKPAKATIELDGEHGNIRAGGPGRDGDISLFSSATAVADAADPNHAAMRMSADGAHYRAGGNGTTGDIWLIHGDRVSPKSGPLQNADAEILLDANGGRGRFGGVVTNGDVALYTTDSTNLLDDSTAEVHLEASTARLRLGGAHRHGDLALYRHDVAITTLDNDDFADIHLEASQGRLRLGGAQTNGDLAIYSSSVHPSQVNNDDAAAIHLRGSDGDIRFGNADLAEEFTAADVASLSPGAVVRLDDQARIVLSDTACDTRVAGIVAGAGHYKPGLVLDHREGDDRLPIAMVGKAFCNVDASAGAVRVGDLLTTSDLAGHARKVCPGDAAMGAVIGKALGSLDDGQGQIPVLVNLQ